MTDDGTGNVTRRVLVVDDEQDVCDLIQDALSEVGFISDCVHSDRSAYAALNSGRAYAALVVDINLGPGTTGFDVARVARAADPAMPVLYVSGQASEDSRSSFGVPGSSFLAKPFELDDLLEALKRLPSSDRA